jgi:glycosyltransferase involved in cell wall biosynthesis
MKVLLWHGYLLTGSGSNVYTANIARSWRASGLDVLLMCQQRSVGDLAFIDEAGDFDDSNASFSTSQTGAVAAAGRCVLLRPSIGSLLPVYVHDDYEHFTAKLFVDLTDDELAEYTNANVAALKTALDSFEPDIVITGHEVMGPYIASLACAERDLGYVAKLHGSALEYAVKKQDRYLRYATEGLSAADVVVGGSRYMVDEASAVIPGWRDRAVVINPGCDVDVFQPNPQHRGPSTVGFVGKLIAQKGVQRLLAALISIRTRPLNVVVVGYGGDETELWDFAQALQSGKLDSARAIARQLGDDDVDRFLGRLAPGALESLEDVTVEFTGRLEHGPLAELLPTFDVLAVPSIVAEAFGMVAAEAAASGVLPVVPDHSGIGEAGAAIEDAIGRPGLLTYPLDDSTGSLAEAIERVLGVPASERRDLGEKAVELARSRWSWDEVARALLEVASPR